MAQKRTTPKQDAPAQTVMIVRGQKGSDVQLAVEVTQILESSFQIRATENGIDTRSRIESGDMPDLLLCTGFELRDTYADQLIQTLVDARKRPPRVMVVTRTVKEDRQATDLHLQPIRLPLSPKQLAAAAKKRLKEPADDLEDHETEEE